jgi:hypothetical protein
MTQVTEVDPDRAALISSYFLISRGADRYLLFGARLEQEDE